jgi:hypothetical protein
MDKISSGFGGTLTGVKKVDIEVLSSDRGAFFSSIRAKSKQNNLE